MLQIQKYDSKYSNKVKQILSSAFNVNPFVINLNNSKNYMIIYSKDIIDTNIEKYIIGFISIKQKDNELQIWNFAIDQKYRGKGFGSKVIKSVQNILGQKNIRLFVKNLPFPEMFTKRLQFYRKMGFIEISRKNIFNNKVVVELLYNK